MSPALVGLLTVLILLALIMTKRLSTMVALIVVPVAASLIMGFGGTGTSKFIIDGIRSVAPTAVMFIFAIIFFGVVFDAGMFDPIINGIIRIAKGNPLLVVMGNAVLAMLVHLDGSGAVTFMITVPAMLPLYKRLNMDLRVLAAVTALGAGVMNILPWGGPTIRAATALKVPVTDLFNPVVPAQICGILTVLVIAFILGKREATRTNYKPSEPGAEVVVVYEISEEDKALRRPRMFWVNIIMTLAVICGMIMTKIAPAVFFMVASVLALILNYPNSAQQRARVDAHAKEALLMASVLLAAGAFTGIMKGTGFLKAMATAAASFIPTDMASHIPLFLALISMPLSLVFDPDSFYFGVLPVIAGVMSQFGLPPIEAGQAAILGQMTTGFPVSPLTPATLLLVGLCGVELGDHQRFTIPLAYLVTLVMTVVCVATGVFPL